MGLRWIAVATMHTWHLAKESKCQCVIAPRGAAQPCLPYDSRFQAATLEEAMISFPDLSIDQDEPGQIKTLKEQESCHTTECEDCQKEMRKRLKEVGLMPTAVNEIVEAQNSTTCKKYRFARNDVGVYEKHHGKMDSSSSSSEDDDRKRKRERKGWKYDEKHFNRHRRQAQPENTSTQGQAIIGERFVLSCTSKGMTTDSSGTVSLCSSCWMWRRLPDNYSPQYINELVCDTSDNTCLSGYATCGVGHRAIEVVRNDSGTMTTVALSAGSYCECRPAKNSAIESLVTGTGLGNSLPALTPATGGTTTGSN
ncbi:hypothetical protein GCK32_005389 [Trichostrongylus colubriformis]|uniref:Uncharacterized protein n=1 Tax=Trichostrongylus colubriformis TaxID=6319 RepID=A0AAN8FU27_TRICO